MGRDLAKIFDTGLTKLSIGRAFEVRPPRSRKVISTLSCGFWPRDRKGPRRRRCFLVDPQTARARGVAPAASQSWAWHPEPRDRYLILESPLYFFEMISVSIVMLPLVASNVGLKWGDLPQHSLCDALPGRAFGKRLERRGNVRAFDFHYLFRSIHLSNIRSRRISSTHLRSSFPSTKRQRKGYSRATIRVLLDASTHKSYVILYPSTYTQGLTCHRVSRTRRRASSSIGKERQDAARGQFSKQSPRISISRQYTPSPQSPLIL